MMPLVVHHVVRLAGLASDMSDPAVQPQPEHGLEIRTTQAGHGQHRRLQRMQARLAEQTASSEALQEALQARVTQLEQLAVSAGLGLPPAPAATTPAAMTAAAATGVAALEAEAAAAGKAATAGEAEVAVAVGEAEVTTLASVQSRFVSAYVDKHNELRAKHCAPPLAYDATLAKQAEECAALCPTGHTCPTQGAGENLAWHGTTTDGALSESVHSWETPVQDWYDEVRDYDWQAHGSINGRCGSSSRNDNPKPKPKPKPTPKPESKPTQPGRSATSRHSYGRPRPRWANPDPNPNTLTLALAPTLTLTLTLTLALT